MLRKFLECKLFSKLWVVRKVWNFIKKEKKSIKYWRISQIVYSHFFIENWKVKTLGTITARIYIIKKKLNERGKKRLNAKLDHHLTRPHTFPRDVPTVLYKYRFQSVLFIYLFLISFWILRVISTFIRLKPKITQVDQIHTWPKPN